MKTAIGIMLFVALWAIMIGILVCDVRPQPKIIVWSTSIGLIGLFLLAVTFLANITPSDYEQRINRWINR